MHTHDEPRANHLPKLSTVRATVVEIRDDPSQPQIILRRDSGEVIALLANPEFIAAARAVGSVEVTARFVVCAEGNKLFDLHGAGAEADPLSEEDRARRIFAKWDSLLGDLAK